MTQDLHKSTQELIRTIEHKDRRFRTALTVFMTILTIGVIVGSYLIIEAFSKEQQRRNDQTEAIIEAQSHKIDEMSDRLRCVAVFFSEPDRANLIITNIDECFTKRIDNGEIRKLDTSSGPDNSNENNNTNSEVSQETQTNTPAPNETPMDPNQPGLEPVLPPEGGSGEEERPARKIFGIPACVPFTDICVRE